MFTILFTVYCSPSAYILIAELSLDLTLGCAATHRVQARGWRRDQLLFVVMVVTAGTQQQLSTDKYATGSYHFNGISRLGESALRFYSLK